ncbi:MAG: succinate dehydrogenase assembly factor 2 [Alphaproteobacteria bacterium]
MIVCLHFIAMHRPNLIAEINWRCQQRGSKELSLQLIGFFDHEKQNGFADWHHQDLMTLIEFLKQDDMILIDFFKQTPDKKNFLKNFYHKTS